MQHSLVQQLFVELLLHRVRALLVLEPQEECRQTQAPIPTIVPTKEWVVDDGREANATSLSWG